MTSKSQVPSFEKLKKTPVFEALSNFGKEVYQNPGIFYWSSRAKKEAEFNATIGVAMGLESDLDPKLGQNMVTYYLPEIRDYISLPPSSFVSYAPVVGVDKLRTLWKEWLVFKGKQPKTTLPSGPTDVSKSITDPVICCGVTHAISIASKLFLNPGEKIIGPNKRWENYDAIFTLQNQNEFINFEFFKEDHFNVEALRNAMSEMLKVQDKIVMILNFPNNPTGYSPLDSEIKNITKMLKEFCEANKKPVVIICDDAYEGFVYEEGRVKESIFYELVNLHPSIIPLKLDGSSKEMLMYGGRIAAITLGLHSSWISADEIPALCKEWDNKIEAIIRSVISNSNQFVQQVLISMLSKGFDRLVANRQNVINVLGERYALCLEAIKEINNPNISPDPAGGGFFLFLNIKGIPANELADTLCSKYKVGVIPTVNKEEKINGIRVAYCSVKKEDINEVFKRIDAAVKELA